MSPNLGDFFLVTNPAENLLEKFLFKLASWGTQSPLVHSGIYVGTYYGHEEPQVIEARPGGVGFRAAKDYEDAIWSTDFLPLTDLQRESIVKFAGTRIGIKYDSTALIATAFAQKRLGSTIAPDRDLAKQPFWIRKLIHQDRIYCSGLVLQSLINAGVEILSGYIPWLTSTGDLVRALGINCESGNTRRGRDFRKSLSWHWIG